MNKTETTIRVEYHNSMEIVFIAERAMICHAPLNKIEQKIQAQKMAVLVSPDEFHALIFNAVAPDNWKDGFVILMRSNLFDIVNRAVKFWTATSLNVALGWYEKGVQMYTCTFPGVSHFNDIASKALEARGW